MEPHPKVGDRIRLIHLQGDPSELPEGTEGVVFDISEPTFLCPQGQVWIEWDTEPPRRFALLPEVDRWEIIS